MKNLKKLMTLAVVVGSIGAMASTPIEKKVPVDSAYIPSGFDSNDNVEIVVEGYLPNLCHKAPRAEVKFEGNKVNVEVKSLYYDSTNPYCPEMVVPFTHTVQLGIMDKGNYEITVNGKSANDYIKEKISVAESSSDAIDEHNYAYVQYIDKDNQATGEVALRGYNPSSCFELDRIDHVNNKKNAFSILPKMKRVDEWCPMKMIPFSYDWKVPSQELPEAEKVLLHVRTMDGHSVNTIYKVND